VIETPEGITVYPARREGERWRAVWCEDGERKQCQAASEDRLAASLEKVTIRLAADAPNMLRGGDELIGFYLSPDRLPVERQWSRKHAETQRSLCERFLRPVIGQLACEDFRITQMQAVVNAAPTAQEGRRVRAMISALTGAGIAAGYLAKSPAERGALAGERPGSGTCADTARGGVRVVRGSGRDTGSRQRRPARAGHRRLAARLV
jgi:hypothetical protein